MVGAWYIIRNSLIVSGVALGFYTLVWFLFRLRFYYHRYQQKARKGRLWHHYIALQKSALEEPFNAKELSPLATLRRWDEGEEAYMMIQHIYWYELGQVKAFSKKEQANVAVEVLFATDEEIKEHSMALADKLKRYMFITNRRILLVQGVQELSLEYAMIRDLHFYIDTMEIFFEQEARILIHSHQKPQEIVHAYQIVTHFWHSLGKVQKN